MNTMQATAFQDKLDSPFLSPAKVARILSLRMHDLQTVHTSTATH